MVFLWRSLAFRVRWRYTDSRVLIYVVPYEYLASDEVFMQTLVNTWIVDRIKMKDVNN